jgi:hypothetical protein
MISAEFGLGGEELMDFSCILEDHKTLSNPKPGSSILGNSN